MQALRPNPTTRLNASPHTGGRRPPLRKYAAVDASRVKTDPPAARPVRVRISHSSALFWVDRSSLFLAVPFRCSRPRVEGDLAGDNVGGVGKEAVTAHRHEYTKRRLRQVLMINRLRERRVANLVTLDSDPISTFVFDSSPVLNFGSGLTFVSHPGPVLDSALRPAFNSDSATNHNSYFNESGG
ncbi:hypothetical protein EVAR_29811_1 [Eumeta japonica]|uniref:Uncharacterized protein n=1 Tax=Eumeta variegata TaxID=151549 RepID=A0A4C1XSI5_EUMVA|nr:hypothetical protein EVAR_29811_1 [Eumeta japonica]